MMLFRAVTFYLPNGLAAALDTLKEKIEAYYLTLLQLQRHYRAQSYSSQWSYRVE